jgi:hypothetical protein
MTDIDDAITLETELEEANAERDITEAVTGRRAIARKYVMKLRRRHPDATPAEVIGMLERHYGTAITAAGAAITVGVIAADVAIAMIPVAGPAAAGVKSASQHAGKQAAKSAVKVAVKGAALGAAKKGAQQAAAGLLPAGDEQLQFEITAIFALAIADIHGMRLDKDQAHALVYGLTNERVSPQQIATMATDVATVSAGGTVGVAHSIHEGRQDWSHWANTLADTLPGGAAQSLVRTIQTGQLDDVRQNLGEKQQAVIEYGVGALAGGVTRFVFGREVIQAARDAFAEAPGEFPAHLELPLNAKADGDGDDEPSAATAALEDAAKATGTWIAGAAGAVGGTVAAGAVAAGSGVASAAGTVGRVFKSVDIDGDGIPDEARALTAVKSVGGAVAGVADSVGGGVAGLFKSRKRGEQAAEVGGGSAETVEL